MPDFALAILGFTFGWGLCALFLMWDCPLLLRYLFETRWPRVPHYLSMLAAAGRVRRAELEEPGSALSRERLKCVRRRFGLVLFLAATATLLTHLFEQLHWHSHEAFEVESFMSAPRLLPLLLAAILGFGCRAYWQELVAGLFTTFQIALVSTGKEGKEEGKTPEVARSTTEAPSKVENTLNYVESKFPWFVEIGLLASMVVVVTLLINPQLLKNLTSFKAGGVEAHFATANGTATVQGGQLTNVDLSRNATKTAWASFSYPSSKEDPAYITYPADPISKVAMEAAKSFFENYLTIIFQYLNSSERPSSFRLNTDLHQLIFDISTDIETDKELNKNTIEILSTLRPELCKPIIAKLAKPVTPGNIQDQSIHDKAQIVAQKICTGYDQAKYAYEFQKIQVKQWDPYIIQAVGDLLFIISSRREQEDFLITATRNANSEDTICPATCETAGQLSLSYAVSVAKVRSDRPWPFQGMITDLKKTLESIDNVLDRNKNEWGSSDVDMGRVRDIRFRRNRFIDLSLGLELFYQRALQGQHLSVEQRETWRGWLTEVRSVLGLFDPIAQWPPPFDEETRASWQRAKADVVSRPGALPDAYVGVVLSLVLIDPAEDVSAHDCESARLLLDALNTSAKASAHRAGLSIHDEGSYEGFLEQVKSIVEGRCKP